MCVFVHINIRVLVHILLILCLQSVSLHILQAIYCMSLMYLLVHVCVGLCMCEYEGLTKADKRPQSWSFVVCVHVVRMGLPGGLRVRLGGDTLPPF